MTTIVYDRNAKLIAADTQYTADDGTIVRMNKIERLADGRYFLGSGHSHPCKLVKRWAEDDFGTDSEPDWAAVIENKDDMRFSCLVVSRDGNHITYIDNELTPVPLLDDVVAIGSGSGYALAALDLGHDMREAMKVACKRDPNTSEPIMMEKIDG